MKENNKKKLFISQVMSGKTKAQIMAMRKRVEDFAEENDYEILDSYIRERKPQDIEGDNIGIWYLGKSLEILAQADAIIMTPGCENARGCIIERMVAEKYNLIIHELKDE